MNSYLIIGGSSGIGAALVNTLANSGANVIATYNTNQPEPRSGVTYVQHDVTNPEHSLDNLPNTLNGLAYCPGAINLLPFKRVKKENLMADFDLQVGGAVRSIQQALPALKEGNGAVVLFSTVAVQTGFNFHSQVAMSKGAIEGLTRSLAAELAPSIRVNAIAPSITDTPLAARLLNSPEKKQANAQRHPLQQIGTPQDIANAAAFLLQKESGWMSGQIVTVDGGISTLKP